MSNNIKCVYLKSNLNIMGGFAAQNAVLPSQFVIVEQDDGSVHLYPLNSNAPQVSHFIPAHNIACISYFIPQAPQQAITYKTELKKRPGRPKTTKTENI